MILIIIYILLLVWLYFTQKSVMDIHDSIPFYDEKGILDHISNERDEQLIINEFIDPYDNVLELGTRYGTVSCLLARKANRVVSLDPDNNALDYAKKNANSHGVYVDFVHGIISNNPQKLNASGYGSSTEPTEESDIPIYTIKQIENLYNIKFDTLVADCEGCLEKVISENDISKFKKIIYEEDRPNNCNYNEIEEKLKSYNFRLIKKHSGIVNHCIFIK